MYTFTDDCLTGIEQIDNEHRHLFDMLNDADRQLKSADSDFRATAKKLIDDLKDYASYHFSDEEKYMESIHDPELPRQKKAHEAFVAKLNAFNIIGASDSQVKDITSDLLDYMARWLLNHIIGSDTLIGKFKSPYAFTDNYRTGIELIDNEHRKLFEIMEKTDAAIHDEMAFDKYDEILNIIDELRDYTEFHFSDEEKFMESIGYPAIDPPEKSSCRLHGKAA